MVTIGMGVILHALRNRNPPAAELITIGVAADLMIGASIALALTIGSCGIGG
ncbi:hypothetical protein [Pseudomonas indica]|uniref:hypothetical protein n=1 Tax=Pseudomonas indica TaxID=137658 RepID=UPI003FD65F47